MAKNLDSIKKLNPEEVKKNRKIVLSYIGEKDAELTAELTKKVRPENRPAAVSNRVDSIRLNKTPPRIINNQTSKREKIERAELIKKEIAKRAELEVEKKAEAERARRRREKLKLEEKLREEKMISRENERLTKIKRAEEILRIKQEVKLAKLREAAKRKVKRQKAIKLFKKNLYNKLGRIFSVIKKNLVYGTLYLIVFLIITYAIFCLLVLRFKVDNNIFSRMARVLPVPAVVTSQGIINYNDWRDLNLANKKNSLAGWVVLKNLSGKYGLPALPAQAGLSVNSPDKALALAFARDEDLNQAGLLRIKKISQLLKNADDLEKLSKYADEFSGVIYYDSESAVEKFGPAIFNLSDNQLSDIIFRDNGYYLAQIINQKNGRLGIKYLFVGAKTLDQYLKEKTAKIKIFILAK